MGLCGSMLSTEFHSALFCQNRSVMPGAYFSVDTEGTAMDLGYSQLINLLIIKLILDMETVTASLFCSFHYINLRCWL